MWLILLIWGLPTSGKTTLSEKLGKNFNVPFLSADFLRKYFQKKYQRYNDHSNRTAEDYYREFDTGEKSSKEHFRWMSEYYDDFEVYIQELSSHYLNDNKDISFIIEWDNLTPELLWKVSNIPNILSLTLINSDIDHISKVVYDRGVWDNADTYPLYIKPFEIEWLKYSISLWISESEKYKIPVFDSSNVWYYEEIIDCIQSPKKKILN